MNNWCSNYKDLTDYVASHPAIEITESLMLIPDGERPEFYRLFNRVLSQFVKDIHPAVLAEASLLSARFAEAKAKLTTCLNFKAVDVKTELNWFLEDPVSGLTRKLFDLLFSLLQGKTEPVFFERQGSEIAGSLAGNLLHRGYLHWTTMSLIQLMEPDGIYSVPVDDESTDSDLTTADKRPGWWTVDVPEVASIDVLRLDVSQYTSFLTPQAILSRCRLNSFVGIRTDFYATYHHAKWASKRLEWFSRDTIKRDFGMGDLWPDMAVYASGSEKDLSVVADYSRVARPDVIVDIMEVENWHETGGIEKVIRHSHVLKPRLGGFVICRHPVPQAVIDRLLPEIKALVVGFDAGRLPPVIGAISEAGTRI